MCGGDNEKCATCPDPWYWKPPELWAVNFEAWAVWIEVQTQWRAGPAGVIGLDYREMRQAIRDLGLTRSRGLESKIKALEKEKLSNAAKRIKRD